MNYARLFLLVLLLAGCSSGVSDPLTPWVAVVDTTASSPIAIEEKSEDIRFRFQSQRCYAGIATTKDETVQVPKNLICKRSGGRLGRFLSGFGEFIGGILLGIFL